MPRVNINLSDEVSVKLNELVKDLKMSKTQILTSALEEMHEKKRIEKRKALWQKGFDAFKDDEEFQKEQLELAEAGVSDGII